MRLSEAKKRPQLSLNELYQVNWFLGIGLALLSIWTAVYLQQAIWGHVVFTTAMVALAFFRPQLTAAVPRILWQAVPFFLVLLLAVDLHFSDDPVPALIRLNILLILYRCLSFRRKREDLQLIVLCLFLVIIVGVLTLALTFVLQILVFTAVAMAFLFNITLMDDGREKISPREVWRGFTWRRFSRKIFALCDRGSIVVAGITFGSVVACSALLFLLIPRFDFHNPLPFLGMSRTSQTGFSESIRFGDVTDIRKDDRVALRVEVTSPAAIPAEPYWRMLVLDEYRDAGFEVSRAVIHNTRDQAKTVEVRYDDWLIGGAEPPEALNTWTFYLEGGVARYMPLTGRFERLRFQENRNINFLFPFHVLGSARANANMLVYQVDNMEFSGRLPDPDFGEYTLDYPYYPDMDFFFDLDYINYPSTTLALPLDWTEREYLEQLVEEIRQGEELTNEEMADRISRWLQSRHPYSMSWSLSPGYGDHVVRWLQDGGAGHCEAFAGAMVLLTRAAGIPSRAVTGFKGGSWNTYENYYMVRYSDAHAWVEIFDGSGEWVRFDPTPGATAPADAPVESMAESVSAVDSSFAAYVDSLRMLWYRRIVSFDQNTQFELIGTLKEFWANLQPRKWLDDLKTFLLAWLSAPWSGARAAELLGLLGAGGLFCFLVAFCVRQDRMNFFSFVRREGDPVRRRAGSYLLRLRSLADNRGAVLEDETVFERIVSDLQRLRFGPATARVGAEETFRRARRYLRRKH